MRYHAHVITILLLTSCFFSANAVLRVRQTHGIRWLGTVELRRFERRITVYPHFLDIEEDIVVAPFDKTRKPPDSRNTLEIYGRFYLPAQAVVTGVLIWDGDKILKGKLKGKEEARSQYEEVVDRHTAPPPRPRDPIIIEKLASGSASDTYELALYPVTWGKSRKFRIRYLVPQGYVGGRLVLPFGMSIPQQIHIHPDTYSLRLKPDQEEGTVDIILPGDTLTRNLPTTLTPTSSSSTHRIQYLVLRDQERSMMVRTSFPEGNWAGDYMLYWGKPPDSLLIKSGLRREVAFLWKWNFPRTFVSTGSQGRGVSKYGAEAIAQSRQLERAVKVIAGHGDKTALFLDKGSTAENVVFSMCGRESATYDSLIGFLQSVDSASLLEDIHGVEPPIRIRVSESQREEFFRKHASEFDVTLKVVASLFSPHEKVIKHIVVLTVGPLPDFANRTDYFLGDTILDRGITFSSYGSSPRYPSGYWPGVPLHIILENHALIGDAVELEGMRVPKPRGAFVAVTMATGSQSYTRELISVSRKPYIRYPYMYALDTVPVDTVSFAGHTSGTWSDSVLWQAFDADGSLLGAHSSSPQTIKLSLDTSVVKLWAGSNNPVADDQFDSNRGARFGVVDFGYSLVALEQDTVPQSTAGQLEDEGVPHLLEQEIFLSNARSTGVVEKQKVQRAGIAVMIFSGGRLRIYLPTDAQAKLVRVYDLRGRLMHVFPPASLRGLSHIDWHAQRDLRKGTYLIEVRTEKTTLKQSFTLN